MEAGIDYVPDDNRRYRVGVDILAKHDVSEPAQAALAKLLEVGYYETMLKGRHFSVTDVARDSADVLTRVAGVTGAAILLALLTTFAEGIAVGRGANQIELAHVNRARESFCNDWPQCSEMRVRGVAKTLRLLIEPLEAPVG